jgi:hypothetical protein
VFDTDGSPNEVGPFDDECGVEPEADFINVSEPKNLFNFDSKLARRESRISEGSLYTSGVMDSMKCSVPASIAGIGELSASSRLSEMSEILLVDELMEVVSKSELDVNSGV